ncbi:hypothetical protein [Streptomyces globisporus]|uniref:hypothetical protein n=1 Tax=Streptomyces globisporus TaxID=1908 RepID=UPI003795C7D0
MTSSHTQRLREERERRRLEREKREASNPVIAPEDGDGAATSGAELQSVGRAAATSGTPGAAKRPQPFTPDLLPATDARNATGSLTAEELDELDRCERAFANADQAQWMRGLALHAVRDRRLYRDGGRTWVEYCEEIGLSESEAHRLIQEYPLTRAISQIWETPKIVAASHVRALLPLVPTFGLDSVAQGYAHLRIWAQQNKQKVTAADLTALTERAALGSAAASAEPLPVAEFQARRKALEAGVPPQAGPPPGDTAARTTQAATASAKSTSPQPPSEVSTGQSENSPNNPGPADTEEESEILDAEIVSADEAKAVLATLQDLQQDISTKLAGASAETLIGIASCARAVDEAARAALGR